MKLLTFILFILIHLFGFSQSDTIHVDLNEMSIDLKTCECILFGGCRQYSYPGSESWKRADSLFIGNQDTVYFVLEDNGEIKIEGNKKPKGEVYGKINFYTKNSALSKVEIWEEVYLIHENEGASWADGYYWSKQLIYKNNLLIKESTRSLLFDEKKEFAQKTEVIHFKNGIKKRSKIKIRYF